MTTNFHNEGPDCPQVSCGRHCKTCACVAFALTSSGLRGSVTDQHYIKVTDKPHIKH